MTKTEYQILVDTFSSALDNTCICSNAHIQRLANTLATHLDRKDSIFKKARFMKDIGLPINPKTSVHDAKVSILPLPSRK